MKNYNDIQHLIDLHNGDTLTILKEIEGYYECPKDKNNKRLGPLVGYAAKYKADSGEQRQYVGDTYINFAKAEQYPVIMEKFAENFCVEKLSPTVAELIDIVCGPQMGGVSIAQMCALFLGTRYACLEKVVTRLADKNLREQSHLDLLRHSINPGDGVMVMEDVLNNFSTTAEAIELIENKAGARVVCIGGLLNRSPNSLQVFEYKDRQIPVFSLVTKQIAQWRQDDDAVINDITAGNVILKPKIEWDTLALAMKTK